MNKYNLILASILFFLANSCVASLNVDELHSIEADMNSCFSLSNPSSSSVQYCLTNYSSVINSKLNPYLKNSIDPILSSEIHNSSVMNQSCELNSINTEFKIYCKNTVNLILLNYIFNRYLSK